VKQYFPGEMGEGLQTLIDEANHENEVVVFLVFGNKAIGLRLLLNLN
jgi:pantothenate synthetase